MNSERNGHRPELFEFAGYRLDAAHRLLVGPDGNPIALTAKAFDLLVYLVSRAGTMLERADIMQAVWPGRVVEDNNLNQAITTLRRAIGNAHIATVPGRGYQFVTPVHEAHEEHRQAQMEPASLVVEPTPTERRTRLPIRLLVVAGFIGLAIVIAIAAWIGRVPTPPATAFGAPVKATPITNLAGDEIMPALSHDGSRVAFSWNENGGAARIFVKQIGANTVQQLSTAGAGKDFYPAWSPDDRQIVFMRMRDSSRFDLIVIPASSGEERHYYSGEREWISKEGFPMFAWTPDGREVWFTTRYVDATINPTYGLHRLRLADGVVTPVSLESKVENYDTSPAISPDGRWLAFTRYHRAQRFNQVMLQRLGPEFAPEGSAEAIQELDPAIYHSLMWSPRSDRLWFVDADRILEWSQHGSLRVAHVNTHGSMTNGVSMASDGDTTRLAIVVSQQNINLFAVPLDAVRHTALGAPLARAYSTATELHPRYSPDGRRIAFVSNRSGSAQIWTAARDGDNPRQITMMNERIVGYPRWAPDSKRIAFHTSATGETRVIWEVDADTAGPAIRRLNGCCPGSWSADGVHLYVSEFDKAIGRLYVWRANLRNGARERLFEGATAWESADGLYLLYAKTEERGFFRRSIAAGQIGAEERLVADYRPALGGLAPVADGFYYIGFRDDDEPYAIRYFDYARREARTVIDINLQVGIGLDVAPDGRELMFTGIDGSRQSDLLLIEFATKPQ